MWRQSTQATNVTALGIEALTRWGMEYVDIYSNLIGSHLNNTKYYYLRFLIVFLFLSYRYAGAFL